VEDPVRRVVDVGSGPGVAAVMLAEAFPTADVTAFDGDPTLLEAAVERADGAGVGNRFASRHGHIGPGLDDLGPADLIWVSHVLHHLEDPVTGIRSLAEVLRPAAPGRPDGGVLAVAEGGLPMRFLPGGYGVGDPSLISRLEAATGEHARRRWGMTSNALDGGRDWPLLLEDAGLRHLGSRTFLLDRPAPVDDQAREFAVDRIAGLVGELDDLLEPADAAALRRLADPADPAALANRPDLFVLGAHTVHLAQRR
jgi:SAM-dependent methyltransferase